MERLCCGFVRTSITGLHQILEQEPHPKQLQVQTYMYITVPLRNENKVRNMRIFFIEYVNVSVQIMF